MSVWFFCLLLWTRLVPTCLIAPNHVSCSIKLDKRGKYLIAARIIYWHHFPERHVFIQYSLFIFGSHFDKICLVQEYNPVLIWHLPPQIMILFTRCLMKLRSRPVLLTHFPATYFGVIRFLLSSLGMRHIIPGNSFSLPLNYGEKIFRGRFVIWMSASQKRYRPTSVLHFSTANHFHHYQMIY